MKQIILLIGLLVFFTNVGCSQKEENSIPNNSLSMNRYSNYDINILFKGSIDIVKNKNQEGKEYFYQSFEVIRFEENNKIIDPWTQHLLSEEEFRELIDLKIDTNQISMEDSINLEKDNLPAANDNISKINNFSSIYNSFPYSHHLSSLYILPELSMKKIKKEIVSYVNKHLPFQIVDKIKAIEIEGKTVLKWRVQSGKTRLDHFVVFGEKYNYLFVSSPYGTSGAIETVISEMKLKK